MRNHVISAFLAAELVTFGAACYFAAKTNHYLGKFNEERAISERSEEDSNAYAPSQEDYKAFAKALPRATQNLREAARHLREFKKGLGEIRSDVRGHLEAQSHLRKAILDGAVEDIGQTVEGFKQSLRSLERK